jgi:hypothetical protein
MKMDNRKVVVVENYNPRLRNERSGGVRGQLE